MSEIVDDPSYPDRIGVGDGPGVPCKVTEFAVTTAPTGEPLAPAPGFDAVYDQTRQYRIRYELPEAPPEAVLCYVDPWNHDGQHIAYFTTRALLEQWGDDWNDAPYDCNAGTPYLWDPEWDGQRHGHDRWTVYRAEFTGPFDTPAGVAFNTPFCVHDINSGVIAWLWATVAGDDRRVPERVVIPAGTTLARFRELVERAGGTVGEAVELKHWREAEADA